MTSGIWRRRKHVEFLTGLLLAALIQSVAAATSNQLPISAILRPNTASLVSSNGIFALGFFPSSSGAGFGFGIWYAQLTSLGLQTVVWMPRRDLKLSDQSYVQLSPAGGVLNLIETVNSAPQLVWTSGNYLVSRNNLTSIAMSSRS